MPNIWVTSDWHFGHDKSFLYSPRGFDNVYDMNEAIIKNYNSVVQPSDDVYVLGDLMLNDNEAGMRCIKSLKGNIHIIRGNHDTDARMELYDTCYNIVEICEGKFLRHGKYHFYLSHYPTLTSNIDNDKPLKARMVSLCGHSHTKDKFVDFNKGLIYHCEVDAHNLYPVAIEDIIKDLKENL
jgi:calcineurin-like phosphoesterase family protein